MIPFKPEPTSIGWARLLVRLRRCSPLVLVVPVLGCAPGQKGAAHSFPQPVVETLPTLSRSDTAFGWFPVTQLAGHLKAEKNGTLVPVPKTTLRLYEGTWRETCCENSKLVAQVETTDTGWFDFNYVKSGRYWLAVVWNGEEKTTRVDLDPRNVSPEGSFDQGLWIGKYGFRWVYWVQSRDESY